MTATSLHGFAIVANGIPVVLGRVGPAHIAHNGASLLWPPRRTRPKHHTMHSVATAPAASGCCCTVDWKNNRRFETPFHAMMVGSRWDGARSRPILKCPRFALRAKASLQIPENDRSIDWLSVTQQRLLCSICLSLCCKNRGILDTLNRRLNASGLAQCRNSPQKWENSFDFGLLPLMLQHVSVYHKAICEREYATTECTVHFDWHDAP